MSGVKPFGEDELEVRIAARREALRNRDVSGSKRTRPKAAGRPPRRLEGASTQLPDLQAHPEVFRDRGMLVGTLVLVVFIGFIGIREARHWLSEEAWVRNGIAGEGEVVGYVPYETCTDGAGGGTRCTDVADFMVVVAEPAAPDGVVTRVFSGVAISDLVWVEQGRTLEVYRDPRPPWDFALKTDHPAVPWSALASLVFVIILLVPAALDTRAWLKSRPHPSTGQALPKWVRRPRPGGAATGTPWG